MKINNTIEKNGVYPMETVEAWTDGMPRFDEKFELRISKLQFLLFLGRKMQLGFEDLKPVGIGIAGEAALNSFASIVVS